MTPDADTLAVAVLVDGHPHDVPGFQQALAAVDGVDCYPQDLMNFAVDAAGRREEYDAAVCYNFHGRSSFTDLSEEHYEQAKAALREFAAGGAGLVVLHHGLPAFPDWEWWSDAVGITDRDLDYEHDVDLEFQIAADHPITEGLSTWEMTDETYEMDEPDGTVLVTTDHPTSMDAIAWTRRVDDARVFCYQSGHDRQAFETPEFRTVLGRGIEWTAGAL
jgi:type 1 glutamine amidotransferase